MDIPYQTLSQEALQKIIEEFVLREGTDYGLSDFLLEEKVLHVREQLEQHKVKIVFNQQDQTCNITRVNSSRKPSG